MNYKKIFKRETKVILYVVIALTIVVIGASYALFMQVNDDSKNQVVTAGTLQITYSSSNDKSTTPGGIITGEDLECLAPKSDEEGKTKGCQFTLSVTNTGTLPSAYSLLIYDNTESTDLVTHDNIKYNLTKLSTPSSNKETNAQAVDITNTSGNLLSNLTKKTDDNKKSILESSMIDVGETIQFSLHIWIKDGAEESIIGKMVSLKLDIVNEVYETTPLSDYLILLTDKTGTISTDNGRPVSNKITHEKTTTTPSLIDYRFVGTNPNNYICLAENGECSTSSLYRIVGVIPTQTTSNGNYENRVKLVGTTVSSVETTYPKYVEKVLWYSGTSTDADAEAAYKAERNTIESTTTATHALYQSDVLLTKQRNKQRRVINSSFLHNKNSKVRFL